MFCTNCGIEIADSVKFCSNCGTRTGESSGAATQTIPSASGDTAQARIFHDQGDILVSDAVFSTAGGASYPIRNISSVVVQQKPVNLLVALAGGALTLLGALFLFAGKDGILFSIICFLISWPFWHVVNNRPYRLMIGAGGVQQMAIEGAEKEPLETIAGAINTAIVTIQRGKEV